MESKPLTALNHQDQMHVHQRGKQLGDMTFRNVLDLSIVSEDVSREYSSLRYKSGMGTLIEERFFGHRANSDRKADFAEAGAELKATRIDHRRDGTYAAGERLVLSMIPYDEEVPASLHNSRLWRKCRRMLAGVIPARQDDRPLHPAHRARAAVRTGGGQ